MPSNSRLVSMSNDQIVMIDTIKKCRLKLSSVMANKAQVAANKVCPEGKA